MTRPFHLQGHRGARGLRPENTLPSFEAALDCGVDSIETDLHLTADGVVVLCHDPLLSPVLFMAIDPADPAPPNWPPICALTLAQLRRYRAVRNPDPSRFPHQDAGPTPVAHHFAAERDMGIHVVPTLADLFAFAAAYAGELGARAGKTTAQRQRAQRLGFDLELKRIPFHPESINDGFTGQAPALLEQRILDAVQQAGAIERTTVRSFDHRCVRLLRRLEPRLTGAVLVADVAPIEPAALADQADAQLYCPAFQFLDEQQVRQLHRAGLRVMPWTVNDPAHVERLLAWGVDGITTDFPDRLASNRGGSLHQTSGTTASATR